MTGTAAFADEPQVRVLILQEVPAVRVTFPGPCRSTDLRGVSLREWKELKWQEAKPLGRGFSIGDQAIDVDTIVLEPADGQAFRVNAQPYRGSLILRRTPRGQLTVINRLSLEDYLVGALTSEVSAGWPIEALKAHAVVSRTMAAHRIWIRRAQEFDMTADTSTHLYHGVAAERPRTRQAVEETKGQVLAYNRELFSATFHANCGGHTEDAAELWGDKRGIPPLEGVEDPYCENLKHYRWRKGFSETEFLEALGKEVQAAGKLQAISVIERTRSGRARQIQIQRDRGSLELTGRQLREKLGANRLRSLKFDVTATSGKVVFDGLGWGHGVGLCQWGAYGMARQGKTMEEILEFYFPQSQRRTLKGLPGF